MLSSETNPVVFDLAVLSAAYWLGFLFRFEFSIPNGWLASALIGWPYVVLIEYALLSALDTLIWPPSET